MTLQAKKYLTFGIILVLVALATYSGMRYLDKVKEDVLYGRQIRQIKEASGIDKIDDFHQKTDALRTFIHDNSQHNMDDEFYALWPDRKKLAAAFIDGLEKKRADLPHMECSTRSNLMSEVLQASGYKVRNIVLYSPAQNLLNHRLIEVQNPTTKAWEAQGVTYDKYWRDTQTKERLSIARVATNPARAEPCNRQKCGWDIESNDGQAVLNLKDYLNIITIHDKNSGLRVTLHADNIAPDRQYTMNAKTGTFCDFFSKNCKQSYMPVSEFQDR